MINRRNFNFAFIGAGSIVFTLRLISDILHDGHIEGGELRLVDINPDVLEDVYQAALQLVKTGDKQFRITKHTDFREVIPGIDFVILTFVTGGFQSWKRDIEICTKHNVLQSVGDTIGPGGIIRTLRNVPVAYEIAKEMEKTAPEAWIINYANPEGAMCLAISKYTKIKAFGLCHGTPDTVKELAEHVYQVPADQLKYRAAGINHLTWITELTIDGKDVYPQLQERLTETGYASREPISAQLFDRFGLYPAPGDRHVGEFFPFYLKEQVLREQDYTWKNADFSVLEGWRNSSLEKINDLKSGKITLKDFELSGETATHFITALSTGKTAIEMANVINRGYIENVSDGIIVEVPVFIDSFGLHPQKIGKLPPGIAAKCDALGREYSLIVEAAISCDRKSALQAMMLDPLACNCAYPDRLLDDLIEAYGDVLPKGW